MKELNKIVGISTGGHDVSYAVLEDGKPLVHAELERYTREKECGGDAVRFLLDNEDLSEVSHVCNLINPWKGGIQKRYPESWNELQEILKKTGGKYVEIGHHRSHAANAFFSSDHDEALIVTLDGGGYCDGTGNVIVTCVTVWKGKGNKIEHITSFPGEFNPGVFWSNCTQKIFGLSIGPPMGNQCGTVMGMAACGDASKYYEEFISGEGFLGHQGFDFDKWAEIASKGEQEQFDIAAALQKATEVAMKDLFGSVLDYAEKELKHDYKNLCLAGGVALNSVMTGKIRDWYPQIEDIYIPPVPYDSGLAIGSPQYVYHQELDKPRVDFGDCFTPYMGGEYSREEVMKVLEGNDKLEWEEADQSKVIDLMIDKNVVSLYGGRSECGRRALGNRSILADPRYKEMKDIVNDRVKHRQWFRPFAPSVLEEYAHEWFENYIPSPYMSFVSRFKEGCGEKVPAVAHFDGTARTQSVTSESNPWYHGFISMFREKTGIPMILNTSFNDREPIVETPGDAVNCFSKTNIDYLYFFDYDILVKKK